MNDKESQFLIDFISNKYLTEAERKKAVELAFKEVAENSISISEKDELRGDLIKAAGVLDDIINNPEAKKIGQSVETESSEPTPHIASRNGKGLPKYFDPALTNRFLIAYNQHPVLKYTCHEIDDVSIVEDICRLCGTEQYDLKAHQELISRSFNSLQKEISIPLNMKGLISGYLNGTGLWSFGVKINWKSSELSEWGSRNPNRVPNPGGNLINTLQYRPFNSFTPFNSLLNGTRIRNFSELCIFFKYLFHIRSDNSLKRMIRNINLTKNWEDKAVFQFIETDFRENMEVFTHVEQVLNAYKKLIELILELVENNDLGMPHIYLSFREEGNRKVFGIHHVNSTYGHTLNDTMSRMGEKFNLIIKKYLNGICDFYLQADFGNNEFAEINLWDDNIMKPVTLTHFKGVKYLLKFKS